MIYRGRGLLHNLVVRLWLPQPHWGYKIRQYIEHRVVAERARRGPDHDCGDVSENGSLCALSKTDPFRSPDESGCLFWSPLRTCSLVVPTV